MPILMIPTNSISATHTSCNTCSSPKRIRKRPRPRNGRELLWARSMFFLHLVEGGRSEAVILLKTGLTTVMTFAPVSTGKVPPHPGDASPLTRGPSSVLATCSTAGWRVESLAWEGAAGLWLASPAGSHFPSTVIFLLDNRAACGRDHHKPAV